MNTVETARQAAIMRNFEDLKNLTDDLVLGSAKYEKAMLVSIAAERAFNGRTFYSFNSFTFQLALLAVDRFYPLDFCKLLSFRDVDFAHDVEGIAENLDCKTGKLKAGFFPRSARR